MIFHGNKAHSISMCAVGGFVTGWSQREERCCVGWLSVTPGAGGRERS